MPVVSPRRGTKAPADRGHALERRHPGGTDAGQGLFLFGLEGGAGLAEQAGVVVAYVLWRDWQREKRPPQAEAGSA